MHGFEFGVDGHCVATGYQTKPPAKCQARAWPLVEHNGIAGSVEVDAPGHSVA